MRDVWAENVDKDEDVLSFCSVIQFIRVELTTSFQLKYNHNTAFFSLSLSKL